MASVSVGDIVGYRRERWVVARRRDDVMPPGTRVDIVRRGPLDTNASLCVGEDDLEPVASPIFTPGLELRYEGITATVVRDDGDTVRILPSEWPAKEIAGGYKVGVPVHEVSASKCALVLRNIGLFSQ